MSFLDKYIESVIETGYYKWLLDGFGNTILITIGALLIGIVIGAILAVTKYFGEDIPAMKPLCWFCDLYTTVIRGIPVVVLLLITFFIIFVSSDDGVMVAIITFGINSGAYMAELIRGGIQAVDKGQMEAGRSLGLSKMQTMVKIIFPQAIRYILPAIGNEMIALLKETSVAGYVAVRDVTKAGDQIRNLTYDSVSPLVTVALTYLTLVIVMTAILNMVEKRLGKR